MDLGVSRPLRCELDLTHRYYNISIYTESVENAICRRYWGKYLLLGMQQGDCDSPATMMRGRIVPYWNFKDIMI